MRRKCGGGGSFELVVDCCQGDATAIGPNMDENLGSGRRAVWVRALGDLAEDRHRDGILRFDGTSLPWEDGHEVVGIVSQEENWRGRVEGLVGQNVFCYVSFLGSHPCCEEEQARCVWCRCGCRVGFVEIDDWR